MLPEIHWIVSAIFAMSLTLSVFSVLAAFNVAFVLSSIINAEGIKLFFSGLSQRTKDNLDSQGRVDNKGLRLILFWVDLPRFFLNLSILDYLIGLGLLQVFYWKGPYNSGPGGLNDRGSGLYVSLFEKGYKETAHLNLDIGLLPYHRGRIDWIDNSSPVDKGFE